MINLAKNKGGILAVRISKETVIQRLKNREQGIIDERYMRKYAVIIPIIEKKEGLEVLFEVRAKHMKRQPGEICFPGGKIDRQDASPHAAAIRELCEEVGISENQVTLLGKLDRIVSPFNQVIFPFSGVLNTTAFSPNKEEVDELFSVPLSFFLSHDPERYDVELSVQPGEDFPYGSIPGGKNYPWNKGFVPEYFYYYQNYIIWGITARIIKHFAEEIYES